MRHTLFQVAVDKDLFHVFQAIEQALLQATDTRVFNMHLSLGDAVRLAHADDLVRGQGAAAHAALMTAAVHLRLQAHARLAPHKQRADALGAIGFVRGQAHQIDGQGVHIDVYAAGGLRRIDVKNDALFAADGADGRHVLDHTDFVVHEHDARQNGVGADRGFEGVQVDQAIGLHIQVRDLKPLALQFAAGVEHSFVLGFDGDQVLAFGFVELRRALDRQIVGFGGA